MCMKYLYKLRLFFQFFCMLFIFVVLSGCVLAPGMDMDSNEWHYFGNPVVKINGYEKPVEIIDITQNVVSELSLANTNKSVIPEELLKEPSLNEQEYKIGVNDVLNILVWGLPEFILGGVTNNNPDTSNQSRQVRADGTIFFPYAGVVDVLGKSRESVRLDISNRLEAYFNAPQVDVSIVDYNSKKAVLTGAFNNPSTQPISSVPLTLSQAIATAGGAALEGDLSDLKLIRGDKEYVIDYLTLAQQNTGVHDIILISGDIVHLPLNQSNKAYIFGEVVSPKSISIPSGKLTLTDLIGEAGGISADTGSGKELYIIRSLDGESNSPKIYRLDVKNPASMILASQFTIRRQDVVFVGPAELTKWNRVISQIFPFVRILDVIDDVRDSR